MGAHTTAQRYPLRPRLGACQRACAPVVPVGTALALLCPFGSYTGTSPAAAATTASLTAPLTGASLSSLTEAPGGSRPAAGQQGLAFTRDGTGFLISGPADYGLASPSPAELQRTTDGGRSWTTVWRKVGYRLNWVGTAGGEVLAAGASASGTGPFLIESENDGASWHFQDVSVSPAVLSSASSGHEAALEIGQIWRMDQFHFVNRSLGFAAPDSMFGEASAPPGELLRTTDGGRYWAPVTLPSGTPTGGIAFVSSKRGFATGYGHCGGEIWATSDGGSTWHVVAGSCTGDGLTSLDFPTGTVGFAVGGQYLKFANNQDLVVLKTTDAGRRWVTVYKNSVPGSSALDANPFGEVAFFDDEDGLALDGGQTMGGNGPVGGHLWRTTDGGRHWSELGVTGLRLVLDGRNDAWLVEGGAGGGGDVLWRSLDRGGTWSPVGNGSLVGVEAIAGSGARLWVWTEAGGFLSADGGRTWKVPPAAMEKALTSTWPGVPVQLAADGTVVVGPGWAGDDSYWLSSDGGLTGRLFSLPALAKVGMTAISFSDPQHGLALGSPYGCDQAQVLATSDGGTRWRQVGTTDLGSISALSYDGAVAVGVNTGCYRNSVIISDNSGRTWSEVANSAACGQVSAYGQTVVMVCSSSPGSGEYVRFSHDWGRHWQRAGHSPPGAPSSAVATGPSTIWACGSPGALWATSDSGARWQVVPLRLPLLP